MDWGILKKEIQKELMTLKLTKSEKEFIVSQSTKECTSQTSIIRKSIGMYKRYIESQQK